MLNNGDISLASSAAVTVTPSSNKIDFLDLTPNIVVTSSTASW